MKYLRLAFGFLTIIPVATDEDVETFDLSRSAGWYPLVGVFIGCVVVLVKWAAGLFVSPFVAAVLATGCWALLTGGLHLDGLADCCDGMLAAVTPERRLEIMKDARLGTFGVVGLMLHLLLKVTLLSALSGMALVGAVLFASALGRWMVLLAVRQPIARAGGLGAALSNGMQWQIFAAASILPLGFIAITGPRGFVAVGGTYLMGVVVFFLARRRLGGVTGDVLGMVIELSEVVVLLVFAAQWPFVF